MILVINAGSATLKFKVFDKKLKQKFAGIVERIGLSNSFISYNGQNHVIKSAVKNHEQALKILLNLIKQKGYQITKVGHRVVHGGEEFVEPVKITKTVLARLARYNKLAPLHNPVNIACIKASDKLIPDVDDYAVFDTAFHSTIPDYAFLYALPLQYYTKHKIRRYGFHGISHHYVAEQAAKQLRKPLSKLNLITCHLGSGCSITAIKRGKVVDTSMGFTPLEGLIMTTRSGDIDPAVVIYLNKKLGMSASKINELLNKKSGLFGLTGFKDMRDVMLAAGFRILGYKPRAKFKKQEKVNSKLALEMFVYRVAKYIGAYKAVLQDVDAIVFTAGIGERNDDIRRIILKKISGLGKIRSLVIPTNESLMIARQLKNNE